MIRLKILLFLCIVFVCYIVLVTLYAFLIESVLWLLISYMINNIVACTRIGSLGTMSTGDESEKTIEDSNTDGIPSIFINKQLLENSKLTRKIQSVGLRKFYEIGDTIFVDNSDDDDIFGTGLVAFECKEVDDEGATKNKCWLSTECDEDLISTPEDSDTSKHDGKQPATETDAAHTEPYDSVTPNIKNCKHVIVNHDNKDIKIKFQSWHAISWSPSLTSGYCMVCEIAIFKYKSVEHCLDEEHTQNLSQCPITESHPTFVIRKFRDKYHCTKCNKLYNDTEIQDHVTHELGPKQKKKERLKLKEIVPKNKKKERQKLNALPTREDITMDVKTITYRGSQSSLFLPDSKKETRINDATKIDKDINENVTQIDNSENTIVNVNNVNNVNNVVRAINNSTRHMEGANSIRKLIDSDFNLFVFGCKLTISVLSFNVICKRDKDYYCGLCHMAFLEEHITNHINWMTHVMLIQNVPFLLEYSVNLIRYVRHMLHCAHCNIPLAPQFIHLHNSQRSHIDRLTRALSGLPIANTPIMPSILNSTNKKNHQTNEFDEKIAKEIAENKKESNAITPNLNKERTNDTADSKKESGAVKKTDGKELNLNKEQRDEITDCKGALSDSSDESSTGDDSLNKTKGIYFFDDIVRIVSSTARFEISLKSYNGIVEIGDGTWLCAFCDVWILKEDFLKHIAVDFHVKNMEKHWFLQDYADDLIRQVNEAIVNCLICNKQVSYNDKAIFAHTSTKTHNHKLMKSCKI